MYFLSLYIKGNWIIEILVPQTYSHSRDDFFVQKLNVPLSSEQYSGGTQSFVKMIVNAGGG